MTIVFLDLLRMESLSNAPLERSGCSKSFEKIRIKPGYNVIRLNFAEVLPKFIVETPIPKAKRSGIGKLNNPAQRRV